MIKKVVLAASAAVFLLLVALVALLFVEIDSPVLGRALLEKIGERSGVQLEVEHFGLQPLRGFRLQGVTLRSRLPDGVLRGTLEGLNCEYRPLAMLRGRFEIDAVTLVRPDLTLVRGPAPRRSPRQRPQQDEDAGATRPAATDAPSAAGERFQLALASIRVSDGTLTLRDRDTGENEGRVEGLQILLENLAAAPQGNWSGGAASGKLHADRVLLNQTELRQMKARIDLHEGELRLHDIAAETAYGPLRADVEVAITGDPLGYKLDLAGERLTVPSVFASADDRPLSLRFSGGADGFDRESLQGAGSFTLEPGKLRIFRLAQRVDELLGKPVLQDRSFDAKEGTFRLAAGRVDLDPWSIESDDASLHVAGWHELAGPVELTIGLELPRRRLEEIELPNALLFLLETSPERATIPLAVRNTLDDPHVGFDLGSISPSAKERAREELRDAVERGVSRLLDRLRGDSDE